MLKNSRDVIGLDLVSCDLLTGMLHFAALIPFLEAICHFRSCFMIMFGSINTLAEKNVCRLKNKMIICYALSDCFLSDLSTTVVNKMPVSFR